jgi:uncharacterized membrane protein
MPTTIWGRPTSGVAISRQLSVLANAHVSHHQNRYHAYRSGFGKGPTTRSYSALLAGRGELTGSNNADESEELTMTIEMAAVTFDGAHTAEKELSALRATRQEPWLTEIAELEHHVGGRFSMKATSPAYDDKDHIGRGLAIGGGTGLLLGAIGGPLGILFLGTVGAITGGTIGASKEQADAQGAFAPLVKEVKAALPHNSSALFLVAEPETAEELVSAVGDRGRQILREELTDEQITQLTEAAAGS